MALLSLLQTSIRTKKKYKKFKYMGRANNPHIEGPSSAIKLQDFSNKTQGIVLLDFRQTLKKIFFNCFYIHITVIVKFEIIFNQIYNEYK